MKVLISSLSFLVATSGMAAQVESLRCYHDMRPVDGHLVEITLSRQDNGRYNATQRIVTPGFGSPVEDVTTEIATNLKCTFGKQDQRLVTCGKSSSEEGDKINSGLQVDLVTTQAVMYTGDVTSHSHFGISAYSPLLPQQRLELEIPLKTSGIPSGCEVK